MIHSFMNLFGMSLLGGMEREDEKLEDTVIREVKEETNLDVIKTEYLNWFFEYNSLGEEFTEYAYVSFVNDGEIILNEEHIEYRWCDMDEFIELIKWDDDKEYLRALLNKVKKG